MSNRRQEFFYPESRLSGFSYVDGTIAFYSQVNALLTPASVVVDVGCGRGAYQHDPISFRRDLRIFRGKVQRVIGIDVTQAGEDNPFLDEFRPITGEIWPLETACADVLVSDNVLEHVADPAAFFAECWRVLKPGGWVCLRTPNVFSYFGLISRLVPNRRHVQVLRLAKDQVREEDTFPTYYRCNTLWGLRRTLQRQGFAPIVTGYDSEPTYLAFSGLTYFFGVLHQRFAPGFMKVGLHGFGKKAG
jgi:SAM-dependent methyltransferase